MNENKPINDSDQTVVAPKTKKNYSVKNYRAFLVNALNFQAEQYQKWSEYDDRYNNLLRKSSSKAYSKALRMDLLKIQQEKKKIKGIIDSITSAIQSLNEYESLAGLSYTLSEDMIKEERAKYFKEDKVEESNEQ